MKMLANKRHSLAYTLVELLIVVLILGALAFVAVPRIGQATTAAKKHACDNNIDLINRQLEKMYLDKGKLQTNWDKNGRPNYFAKEVPECPFGVAYVLDESTHHIEAHNH